MNRTTTVLLFALPALSACGQDRTELSLPESNGSPTGSAPVVAAIPAAGQVEDRTLTVWVRLKEGAPASPRAEFFAAGARFVSRFHGAMPIAIDIPANHLSSLTARSWLEVVAIDSSGGGRLQGDPRRMAPEALTLFPPQSVSWSIQYVGAPVAHARGFTGSGVKIGLLDDGLYCGHSDLYGSVIASYDFAGNQPACVLGSHGTYVAGVLAGRDNSIDVLGVAPSASLYNLRICNLGDCSNGRLYDAIAYAASAGIQVLNYSIADCGGNPPALPLRQALEAFSAGGGIFVAAGGNGTAGGVTGEACDPGDPVGSIAAANYTIAVAAHLSTGLYHPDYQYGAEIDLSAPTFTQTLSPLGGVTAAGFFGGTSAATPHVAGAAAVLLSAGFPPAKVYQRLKDTAINPVGTGHSYAYGWGRISLGDAAQPKPRVDGITWCTAAGITSPGPCLFQATISGGAPPIGYLFEFTRSDQPGSTVLGWGGAAQSYTVQPGDYTLTIKVTPRDNAYGRMGFYAIQEVPVCTGTALMALPGPVTTAAATCGGEPNE